MFESVKFFWHSFYLLYCSFLSNVMKYELRLNFTCCTVLHLVCFSSLFDFWLRVLFYTIIPSHIHLLISSVMSQARGFDVSQPSTTACNLHSFVLTVNRYYHIISQHKHSYYANQNNNQCGVCILVSVVILLHMLFPRALFQVKM